MNFVDSSAAGSHSLFTYIAMRAVELDHTAPGHKQISTHKQVCALHHQTHTISRSSQVLHARQSRWWVQTRVDSQSHEDACAGLRAGMPSQCCSALVSSACTRYTQTFKHAHVCVKPTTNAGCLRALRFVRTAPGIVLPKTGIKFKAVVLLTRSHSSLYTHTTTHALTAHKFSGVYRSDATPREIHKTHTRRDRRE